jgi:serine/threonine-protein kinase
MGALFTIHNELRYEIIRKLADGGMGVVYEVEQHGACGFTKRVAIKVIRQSFASQKSFIEDFIGEAKLVADLIHTNIVQTYHLGEARGIYFIAMELIRGVNLDQLTEKLAQARLRLPVELAVFIASRVARGLAYAHSKADKNGQPLGIVHRDVNFKNILVAFEGDVKLTDFGVAKARGFLSDNEGKVVAGKADYMSPEQADFKKTDPRSDLFSTGIVLAHLLLGINAFKGATFKDSLHNIQTMPIPDFTQLDTRIDASLNAILRRALSRDLALRYQSAAELLYDLEYHIYHRGYGPTNETLGKFMRELFGAEGVAPVSHTCGGTDLLEKTAQLTRTKLERESV